MQPKAQHVANQTGFYDFVTSEGKRSSIESFFNETETKIKYAIQALIENPNAPTLLENSPTLAKFFALQESRTPIFRDVHDDTVRLANQRLKPDGFEFPSPTENDTKEFHARFLVDMTDSFADILLKMKWILVSNKTAMPFWTSDNPIVRYNPHKSELVSNLGLQSPGIQLHIPISPALAITICDPFEYADMPSELPAFAPNVDFNNSGQVIYSRRFGISARNDS